LSLPDFELPVLCDLSSGLLILFDGEGLFAVRGGSESVAAGGPEVECSGMGDDPVVPDRDGVFLPLETHLKIGVLRNLVEEEVQDGVRLGLGHSDNSACKSGVDIDALPACAGVNTDYGMDGLHFVAADVGSSSASTLGLGSGAVDRGEALEVFLESGAQGRVQGVARAPEGVSTNVRDGIPFQRGGTGWLQLV